MFLVVMRGDIKRCSWRRGRWLDWRLWSFLQPV